VTAHRRGLTVGGGSALAALPSTFALLAMGLGDTQGERMSSGSSTSPLESAFLVLFLPKQEKYG